MSSIRKNEPTAGKRTVYIEFMDLDGNPLAGQTFSTASSEVFTSSGGGAWAAAANNGTAVGNGVYAYTFSQAEVNGAVNEVAVRFVKAGYRDQFAIAAIVDPLDRQLDIWQYVIENSTTAEQMVRGFASALMAKANGFDGATRNFRDLADTKNRIVATVDATGRTAVTLTLT